MTESYLIDLVQLEKLFQILKAESFELIAPVKRGETIFYAPVNSVGDLPIGWSDFQEKGIYRLEKREDRAIFAYNTPINSWKDFLNPPRQKIWETFRDEDVLKIRVTEEDAPKYAFIGVRGCELAAIAIQDKVFLTETFSNESYRKRRSSALIIAVNCTKTVDTCFCTSLNTGPSPKKDYDLLLTEIIRESEPLFIIKSGSAKGEKYLSFLLKREPLAEELLEEKKIIEKTSRKIKRKVKLSGLKERLVKAYESPLWQEIGKSCLSCTNCTMVCPTCFCANYEDHSSIDGKYSFREQKWDSCFSLGHSYLHGGSVRKSTASRYRQWLTHKFSTWQDQFASLGCTGCGRCITWCPAQIDLTEELAKF